MNKAKKPLYKTFLKLRCNPQSREKLFNFKKQKWANVLKVLKRIHNIPRFLYDQPLYYKLPKSTVIRSKTNYRNTLLARQRFKLLFGQLGTKALKKSERLISKPTKNQESYTRLSTSIPLKVLTYYGQYIYYPLI